jgi:hypothetical protein
MTGLPRIFGVAIFTSALVGVLGCYNISCGCPADIRNNTPYYLHLLGQDESHLYVPPGGLREMGFESGDELEVLIAPGQEYSTDITIPISCAGCWNLSIDIQWDRSDSTFLFERSGCSSEPDASLDAGG